MMRLIDRLRPNGSRHWRMPIWLIVALTAAAFTVGGYTIARLGQYAEWEKTRAERATAGAIALCDQVQSLDQLCVVDPTKFRGADGKQGAQGIQGVQGVPGRSPTEAEIAAAVVVYLVAHPPQAGPIGPRGETGGPGSGCLTGQHQQAVTFRDTKLKRLVSGFICVWN